MNISFLSARTKRYKEMKDTKLKKLKTNPLVQKISNKEIEQDNNANACNMLERPRERTTEFEATLPAEMETHKFLVAAE